MKLCEHDSGIVTRNGQLVASFDSRDLRSYILAMGMLPVGLSVWVMKLGHESPDVRRDRERRGREAFHG